MSDQAMRVDMIGAARDAQWNALTFLGPGSVRVMAPAKVNLFLAVGDRRADGRHDVTTVMHALALHDVLHVQVRAVDEVLAPDELPEDGGAQAAAPAAPDGAAGANRLPTEHVIVPEPAYRLPAHIAIGGPARNLRVSIDVADKGTGDALSIPARDNIVFKAADVLARVLGFEERCAIDVRLEKSIPHQAGLGGGSSDAAALLLALAKAWGWPADDPRLEIAATVLGADVAFFLHGGCALLDGEGEHLVRTMPPLHQSVVVVKPPVGVPTGAAYAAFDEAPVPVDPALLRAVEDAPEAAAVPLVNNLAPAAEALVPELAEARAWALAQPGARDVLLCGSGAATFAVMDGFDAAVRAAAEAQRRGWWARATTFSGVRAALLPS